MEVDSDQDDFKTDDFTGELYNCKEASYAIPTLGSDITKWSGNYSCPSTALGSIYEIQNTSSEDVNYLIDIFQASLRRRRGMERCKVTIFPAAHACLNIASKPGCSEKIENLYSRKQQRQCFVQVFPSEGESVNQVPYYVYN